VQWGGGTRRTSVIGNLFYKIEPVTTDPYHGPNEFGVGLFGDQLEMYGNTLVDVYFWVLAAAPGSDIRCNTVVDTPGAYDGNTADTVADNNFYYNARRLAVPGTSDVVRSTAAESDNRPFCFVRKRITAPEQVCIPWAVTTRTSPHDSACPASLGSRAGIGVDDRIWDLSGHFLKE
jgi:hypothetical protein